MTFQTLLRTQTDAVIKLAMTALVSLAATGASAGTVVFDGANAVGIDELNIGGTFYDVSFERSRFVDLFGSVSNPSPVPTFFGNLSGAQAARDAINGLLNSVGDPDVTTFAEHTYRIALGEFAPGLVDLLQSGNQGGNGSWSFNGQTDAAETTLTIWATFEASDVPAPASVVMMGFVGLLALRKRAFVRLAHAR